MAPFSALLTSSYRHSAVTVALSGIVSEIKRDSGWLKIAIFYTPLHSMPLIRETPAEFYHNNFFICKNTIGGDTRR